MAKRYGIETKDPGSGSKYYGRINRLINRDGTFNVKRAGTDGSIRSAYHGLLSLSWPGFFLRVFLWYLAFNLLFAIFYVLIGVDTLGGVESTGLITDFGNAFFFSVQTFTTVGYGHVHPIGLPANIIASIEALCGLLTFALFTGTLYGRFSRPNAKLYFSPKAIISPYKDISSLQFRVANLRDNVMMELNATVLLVLREKEGDSERLRYYNLKLETESILFMPLSWTVVHPINEDSPLYGMCTQELESMESEIMVMVKGFDDGFGQHVYTRFSYTSDEMVCGARFVRPFESDGGGGVLLDMEMVGQYEKFDLDAHLAKNSSDPVHVEGNA